LCGRTITTTKITAHSQTTSGPMTADSDQAINYVSIKHGTNTIKYIYK